MPKLGLRPYATIEEGAEAYFGYNFTRIENVFEKTTDVKAGITSVTGQKTIETGLANLDGVVVCLQSGASAGAAYVMAVVASPSAIRIDVYTNTFGTSVTAVNVQWIAVGELILT